METATQKLLFDVCVCVCVCMCVCVYVTKSAVLPSESQQRQD